MKPGTALLKALRLSTQAGATALALLILIDATPVALAEPRPPSAPWPEQTLSIFGFDERYESVSFKPSAFGMESAAVAESWSGFALIRDATSMVPVAVPVVDATSGRKSITLESGTIRVWFSPDWSGANAGGKGPGNYARLLELVGLNEKNPEVVFSLYLDPEGTAIYFSGQGIGGPTDFLKAPVQWQAGEWHLLEVSYDRKSSSLSIDGEEISTGGGVPEVASWKVAGLGLIVGTDLAAGNPAQGQFEELTTMDYWPDADAQRFYFKGSSQQVWLGPVGTPEEEQTKQAVLKAAVGEPMEKDGGGNGPMEANYSSTDLYLEIIAVSNSTQLAYLVIHNTLEDELYEILSAVTLTNAWSSEGTVVGSAGQDWTPTAVPVLDRTNTLFFRARSLTYDSDGQGLPDWWQLENFGQTGVDPYGDADNDGWSNIEEFQNGTNPNVFNTPPAPRGLSAAFIGTSTNVNVTWNRSRGPVTGYTVERMIPELGTVDDFSFGTNDTSFVDNFPLTTFRPDYLPPTYSIVAHYAAGDSAWHEPVPLFPTKSSPFARIVRGQSRSYLVVSGLPHAATAVRINRMDFNLYPAAVTNFDVAVNTITNGVYLLPDAWLPPIDHADSFQWWIQTIVTNGAPSDAAFGGNGTLPFFDGSGQLRQNLSFLLRVANASGAFEFTDASLNYYPNPTNYAYASFYEPDNSSGLSAYQKEFRPFEDNYLYRNFVFSSAEVSSNGFLTTGVDIHPSYGLVLNDPPTHVFQPPATQTPISSVLSSNDSKWTYFYPLNTAGDLNLIGITLSSPNFVMASAAQNIFGLYYQSAKLAYGTNGVQFATLNAGGSTPKHDGYFYPESAQPILHTVNYYFCRPDIDLFPGHNAFSTTNTTPLMVTSVGDPYFIVAGFAKQSILNGSATKFGYLGQYFDKAYKVGTNGVATTNQTGILSEYGEFFPTETGLTALLTKADTNQGGIQGTGLVHIISLSTDANHDSTIDTRFAGPDFTAYSKPFRFWVNDDNDKGDLKGNDIPGYPAAHKGIPNGNGSFVGGVRDLVDFFPVYINIQSVLQTMTTNQIQTQFHFHLRQADSALNFVYTDLKLTNSHSYLTDTNVAASLGAASVNPIDSSGVPVLNGFLYGLRSEGKGVILVEARANTSNPLVFEIWDGTNLVAETSLHLSIDSVETMFRQKNLIRQVETNSAAGFADRLADSDAPNEPDTNGKNFVFLHGYNVNPGQARGSFAETFKRMYWSGSRAKFYGVTYHGYESQWNLFEGSQIAASVTPNLQTNIVNAFATAPKLANFFATLSNETVVAAHSLGNMVVLSALSDWNANIQKYFMIDAAVASEAIDGGANTSTNMIHPDWYLYTNRLYASKWYRLFSAGDHRSELTWSNRLSNLPITNIYNFYSSGEEVLREHVGPPPDVTEAFFDQVVLNGMFSANPVGTYTWAWQEKMKGRCAGNWILGSNHGGWRFSPSTNYYTNYFYQDGWVTNRLGPSEVANVPDAQLRTNAFFDFNSGGNQPFTADSALYGASASTYAQANRNRILADAIPALTLPAGANPVPRLSPQGQPPQNFDMQAVFENGWPSSRPPRTVGASASGEWHHSDFREVAYTFTYKMFDSLVNLGNLK